MAQFISQALFVILIIAIILFALFSLIILAMILLSKPNRKINEPDEKILKSEESKNALVIFQPSAHNTSKLVSYKLAKFLHQKGYSVTINYPSNELEYNMDDYDLICFGTPSYMGNPSSVLKKYISSQHFKNKKIFLYSVGEVSEETKELDTLKELFNSSNNIKTHKFIKKNIPTIHEELHTLNF